MANFVTDRTGTLRMDVATNVNGNIAVGDDTVAGKKSFSLPGVSTDVTLAQADTLYTELIDDIVGSSHDTLGAVQIIQRKVAE